MKVEKQDQARDLYLNQGKSQTEIAQKLGVGRKTIYNWIKAGAWKEMKKAHSQVPRVMVQYSYDYIEAIHRRIADRKLNHAILYTFITTEDAALKTDNSPSALTLKDAASSMGKERKADTMQILDNQCLKI